MSTTKRPYALHNVPRRGCPERWLTSILSGDNAAYYGVTTDGWQSGATAPAEPGWYERLFTDGVLRHWWDGEDWALSPTARLHWRQVGDYPAWRVPP